ncbi:MAG: mechanosensitive ion channel [Legionellaceae bacterium]|nr:mechanosensitive ion channel [Legionellaceae bacterium]
MMMQKRLRVFLSILFLLFAPTMASAANGADDSTQNLFDVNNANQQFDEISLQLATKNIHIQTLSQAIERLSILASEADACVQKTDDEIKAINLQIQTITGAAAGKKILTNVDTKYLEKKYAELKQTQANCRLFFIRSGEAIQAYRDTLLSTQKKMTFSQGKHLITKLNQLPTDLANMTRPTLNVASFEHWVDYLLYAAVLLFFALLFSWRLKPLIHQKYRTSILQLILNIGLVFFILCFSTLLVLTINPFSEAENNITFQHAVLTALMYLTFVFIYRFIFDMKWFSGKLVWKNFDLAVLKKLGLVISTLYFVHIIGLDLLSLFATSQNLIQLFKEAVVITSWITLVYFTVSFYQSNAQRLEKYIHSTLVYKILGLIVVCLLMLDFLGYAVLAVTTSYVLFSFLLTSTLGTLLFLCIGKAYGMLNNKKHTHTYLKKLLGYSKKKPLIEFILLKLIGQIIVIVSMTFLFAHLIGEASYFLDNFLDKFYYGFKAGGMMIVPAQWLIGLFVFCLLSLFSRYIAANISRNQQFEEAEEKQVALASIIMYVGIAIAIIFGLLLAGFNFTSLAIIAGALSVGIGLGLQSIVNNFLSGLILLIEQPIKPGDRIKIDDIEGFVKKVSIRSTQIMTPSKEDIIIPNSNLITHHVTNYMFSDKYWRVNCPIGVAYGSDTAKVCKVLMDVALANPEVVRTPSNKPLVLFRSFGDSALLFELWCLIKDVNGKYVVTSELNLAIDEAFRKNNISIAFPQQDVHIKFDQDNPPWNKDD